MKRPDADTLRVVLILALFALGHAAIQAACYPHLLQTLEGDDFFQTSSDFFFERLAAAPGLLTWFVAFLLQFFRVAALGAAIEGLLLFGAGCACLWFLSAGRKERLLEVALLPPVALAAMFPHAVNLPLEAIVFFALLAVYARLSRGVLRSVFAVVVTLPAFFLVSLPVLLLLCVAMAAVEWARFGRSWRVACPLLGAALSVGWVYLSNAVVGFIALEKRFFYTRAVAEWMEVIYLLVYAVVAAAALFRAPQWGRVRMWLGSGLMLAVAVGGWVREWTNPQLGRGEELYTLSSLAERGQWEQLLRRIPVGATQDDPQRLAYALLAESQLGTLAEHLFSYPIDNPEQFLFRGELDPEHCMFNRLFYACLGVYDEAFHQALEYAVKVSEGICFASLRQMADYALRSGETDVADKFRYILSKSSFNGAYVKALSERIAAVRAHRQQEAVPLRSSFVGDRPLASEMVRLLEEDPTNRRRLDYLLCSLLMQRQLNKFRIIYNGFPLYKEGPCPRAYAEAAAILQARGVEVRPDFDYAADYDTQFAAFYRGFKSKDQTLPMQYAGSYWTYYVFSKPLEESHESRLSPTS